MEEKKLRKEQEKLQKAALKAEAAKLKELEKEKKKLEKFKVIQLGKIGGHLVTKFGDKGLSFELTSNLVKKSIIWKMSIPEETSQHSLPASEIPYILLVYEAEEFCKIVNDGSFFNHISSVQTCYPDYKICCLTNRLMSYINKRENDKYKNRNDSSGWKRPPVEEVFAKLTTQFANVHSRQCADEAELAEHVVGLTFNLAKCHSRAFSAVKLLLRYLVVAGCSQMTYTRQFYLIKEMHLHFMEWEMIIVGQARAQMLNVGLKYLSNCCIIWLSTSCNSTYYGVPPLCRLVLIDKWW